MKKENNMKVYLITGVLFCIGFLSCKKDNENSNNILNEVSKNLSVYNVIPYNSYTFLSPIGIVRDSVKNGFGAILASAFGTDVVVVAKIDTSEATVMAYDSLFNVHYPVLPPGLFTIMGSGQLHIKAGQILSSDSLYVQLGNLQNIPDSNQQYAIPILLQSTTAGAVLASKLMFERVSLNIIYNNIDPSNNGLTGTTMDRTNWSVTSNDPADDYKMASYMLDGDVNTGWISTGVILPTSLVLDMSTSNTVNGFTFITLSPGYNYDIYGFRLQSSNDGVLWKQVGNWTGDGSNNTIKFIVPVTARYFKFIVTKTADYYNNLGLAELNGIN